MIIAVSGYNASGKTTVAKELMRRLESQNISVEIRRFALLYPGTYIGKKKQKRNPTVSSQGNVGLRSIEGQRGNWDQPLGWSTFVNIVAASLAARWIAMIYRKRVIIYDRFLYDRCMHFAKDSWRMRIAKRTFIRPTVTLVLLPKIEDHEKRFLDRIKKRHGIKLEEMSTADRAELEMVRKQYRALTSDFPECVLIDTSDPNGLDKAWDAIAERLSATKRRQ